MEQQRHLAAILFTDIVGYTAMMQENEANAVAVVKKYHSILQTVVAYHSGKIINDYGDGSLCTFSSTIDAIRAAIEIQEQLKKDQIPLRIGLHIGEILFEDGKVFGDGVNVASRIQSLGQANTILFSGEINSKIRNQPEFNSVSLGKFEFKNVDEPIEVFALSNAGLIVPKKEEMSGKLKEVQKRSTRKNLIIALAVILLLVSGAFIYTKWNKESKFTGNDKSIAVLPFVNMSGNKETESFSMGISSEITNQLSKIGSLSVRAASSAMRFQGEKIKTLREIADELNVAAIVTGQYQIESDKINVNVELTDINSDKVIWSRNYNNEWKDIFSIQNAIAEKVVFELNTEMTKDEKKKIEKKPTDNPEAYKYYLQASHLGGKFFETFNKDYYENGKMMYEKAISVDSNYAMAYAGLADLYNTYFLIEKDSSLLALQNKNIEKAWSIDSTIDFINLIQGYVFQADAKFEDAYKCFRRAFEVAPNNTSNLFGLSQMLSNFGLVDEAKILTEKSIKLNPLSSSDYTSRGTIEKWQLNLDSAINDFQTALKLEPNLPYAIISLGEIYCIKNMPEDATNAIRKYEKLNQKIEVLYPVQAYIYAKLGDKKKALELSNDWQVYLALRMKEELLTALIKSDSDSSKRFYLNDYINLKNYSRHKDFDIIRNDPRFLELMEKKRVQYEINKKKFSIAGILN